MGIFPELSSNFPNPKSISPALEKCFWPEKCFSGPEKCLENGHLILEKWAFNSGKCLENSHVRWKNARGNAWKIDIYVWKMPIYQKHLRWTNDRKMIIYAGKCMGNAHLRWKMPGNAHLRWKNARKNAR